MTSFTGSVIEQAALAGLESVRWQVSRGSDIAPKDLGTERSDYRDVILGRRFRDSVARLNSTLTPEALASAPV